MKILISWLGDVNTKYGPLMVLAIIVVLVALVVIVSQLSGLSVEAIAKWLGGL